MWLAAKRERRERVVASNERKERRASQFQQRARRAMASRRVRVTRLALNTRSPPSARSHHVKRYVFIHRTLVSSLLE